MEYSNVCVGLKSGTLKPIIDRTFPLDAIADGHNPGKPRKTKK